MPTGNGTIGNVNLTVNGATTIAATRSLIINSATGNKLFYGGITNNGIWSNTANEAITIRNGLGINGTFTGGTGVYTFDATQGISKIRSITFGGNVTVTGAVSVTNTNASGVYISTGILNGSVAGSTG